MEPVGGRFGGSKALWTRLQIGLHVCGFCLVSLITSFQDVEKYDKEVLVFLLPTLQSKVTRQISNPLTLLSLSSNLYIMLPTMTSVKGRKDVKSAAIHRLLCRIATWESYSQGIHGRDTLIPSSCYTLISSYAIKGDARLTLLVTPAQHIIGEAGVEAGVKGEHGVVPDLSLQTV